MINRKDCVDNYGMRSFIVHNALIRCNAREVEDALQLQLGVLPLGYRLWRFISMGGYTLHNAIPNDPGQRIVSVYVTLFPITRPIYQSEHDYLLGINHRLCRIKQHARFPGIRRSLNGIPFVGKETVTVDLKEYVEGYNATTTRSNDCDDEEYKSNHTMSYNELTDMLFSDDDLL